MDLSGQNLAVFTAGALIGATSFYIWFKLRTKPDMKVWKSGMEERFEFSNPKDEYRLVLAIRHDLKMQKGKVAAQCGHASVAAYAKAQEKKPLTLKRWLKYGGTKITVKIDSEKELLDLDKKARSLNVLSSIVRDAGQTQVEPGSRTVVAIGPAPKSLLDQLTGHLKLY